MQPRKRTRTANESFVLATQGDWDAKELSAFLDSISTVYDVLLSIHVSTSFRNGRLLRPSVREVFDNLTKFTRASDQLRIRRLQMASPGVFEFTGSAPVMMLVSLIVSNLLRRLAVDVAPMALLAMAVDKRMKGKIDDATFRTLADALLSFVRIAKSGKINLPINRSRSIRQKASKNSIGA